MAAASANAARVATDERRAAAGRRAATRSGGVIFFYRQRLGLSPGLFCIHGIYQFMLLNAVFLDTYPDKYYFLLSDEGKET